MMPEQRRHLRRQARLLQLLRASITDGAMVHYYALYRYGTTLFPDLC
jgi:hypothetical protein